jgi:hypothetical protein
MQAPGSGGYAAVLRQIQQTVSELLGAEIPADQVRLVLSLY